MGHSVTFGIEFRIASGSFPDRALVVPRIEYVERRFVRLDTLRPGHERLIVFKYPLEYGK